MKEVFIKTDILALYIRSNNKDWPVLRCATMNSKKMISRFSLPLLSANTWRLDRLRLSPVANLDVRLERQRPVFKILRFDNNEYLLNSTDK